ncbi:MerR family transcriptional regulator [Plantibacter sp. VKM Ac-2880]|uniref:MerR family transcriptional regulator n=1 Tax=Plantibacter sp. VKM Ac-2880 TaxID=2783827 RepID=UPI00188E7745|nr:MerR family transcriptional regulator [Plantibacter sp. VKM Ac-2880]MBF4569964.1 MerR family transcriptional regulator [Plantibacter sp. VKM Ac-2880]
MRIGELAAATGSTPRLLRYYEQQGLLRPTRCANGYREYGDHLVAKVQRIRELIAVGMPTALILEILPCFEDDDTIYQVTPSAEVLERLLEHRARLDAKVSCIQASRDAIDVYLDRVGSIVV